MHSLPSYIVLLNGKIQPKRKNINGNLIGSPYRGLRLPLE